MSVGMALRPLIRDRLKAYSSMFLGGTRGLGMGLRVLRVDRGHFGDNFCVGGGWSQLAPRRKKHQGTRNHAGAGPHDIENTGEI